jgi:ribosomal protein L10
MNKNNKNYLNMRLRILPSHDRKITDLKNNLNSEYELTIFKNDIVRIAIAEFLETNQDLDKFKETLEKHNYI